MMLIKKFLNFKHSNKLQEGYLVSFFHTDEGRCFYDIMNELDSEAGKYLVVGCQKEGWVCFHTTGVLSGMYGPVDGGHLYVFELNDLPDNDPIWREDYTLLRVVDDKIIRMSTKPEPTKRSKEDILEDLNRLREELLNTKE